MIYTSYYDNVKQILEKKSNICFSSISGKTSNTFIDFCRQNNINFFKLKDLMPKLSWWKEWHEKFKDDYESEESKKWYIEKYNDTVLSKLNPHDIVKHLYELADHHDICLLCYETPDKFCHRHLVSEWLNKNGFECKEL